MGCGGWPVHANLGAAPQLDRLSRRMLSALCSHPSIPGCRRTPSNLPTWIGRSRMRATPSSTKRPRPAAATAAVSGRMAVPALPRNSSAPSAAGLEGRHGRGSLPEHWEHQAELARRFVACIAAAAAGAALGIQKWHEAGCCLARQGGECNSRPQSSSSSSSEPAAASSSQQQACSARRLSAQSYVSCHHPTHSTEARRAPNSLGKRPPQPCTTRRLFSQSSVSCTPSTLSASTM